MRERETYNERERTIMRERTVKRECGNYKDRERKLERIASVKFSMK